MKQLIYEPTKTLDKNTDVQIIKANNTKLLKHAFYECHRIVYIKADNIEELGDKACYWCF